MYNTLYGCATQKWVFAKTGTGTAKNSVTSPCFSHIKNVVVFNPLLCRTPTLYRPEQERFADEIFQSNYRDNCNAYGSLFGLCDAAYR